MMMLKYMKAAAATRRDAKTRLVHYRNPRRSRMEHLSLPVVPGGIVKPPACRRRDAVGGRAGIIAAAPGEIKSTPMRAACSMI